MTSPIILITGCLGQVGWELQRTLATLGKIVAIDRDELDLTQSDLVRAFIRDLKPALIVNAAAYTAVDLAEQETKLAQQLNADMPRVLAEEAKSLRAPFITYSTDYVFDGTSPSPYTEESVPYPLSHYGRTKLAGDQAVASIGGAHLIFRTSWVYGARGKNFLLTMLRLAQDRTDIRVVDDQVGAPTWCRTIAEATAQIVASGTNQRGGLYEFLSERRGVYNMVSAGQTSWFGFAKAIFQQSGGNKPLRIVPIATREYPTPAQRPKNSLLSTGKLRKVFAIHMPDWEYSLAQVIACLPGK